MIKLTNMKIINIRKSLELIMVVTIAVPMLTASCKGGKGRGGEVPVRDTIPLKPQVKQVVLYLDASVSMQGYLTASKSTNFGAVANAIEGLVPNNKSTYLFKDKPENIDDLSTKIRDNRVALDAQESDLRRMISIMAEGAYKSDTTCYFLLTDGILSGSNKQINNSPNRSYNITNATDLSQGIYNTLKPYKGKLSGMVLQYEAPFNGRYSKYNNDAVTLSNVMRPYYVIALGAPHIIQQIHKDITAEKRSALAGYKNESLFGFDFEMNSPQMRDNQTGVIFLDQKYKIQSKASSVVLEYDVSKLPSSLLSDIDSLIKHTTIITCNDRENQQLINGENYNIKCTDKLLTIHIKDKTDLCIPGKLLIRLGWWMPSWIEKLTDRQDTNPKNCQTFNLAYLLGPFSVLNNGKNGGFLDNEDSNIIELTNK